MDSIYEEKRMSGYLKTSVLMLMLSVAVISMEGCATADVVGSTVLKYVMSSDPTIIKAKIQVAKDVNPDSRGRPSPVKTRFFLLESLSLFKSADFYQLKEQDRELLGDDIRLREEQVFKPGDSEQLELSLPAEEMPKDDKLFLGVMVGYWDLDRAEWRAVHEVELEETTEVIVEIARSKVSIKAIE